jgi:hypothetical protein
MPLENLGRSLYGEEEMRGPLLLLRGQEAALPEMAVAYEFKETPEMISLNQ